MIFHEVDNPMATTLSTAVMLENEHPGEYVAEPKGEGWRSPLYKYDKNFIRHSKKTNGEEARRQPPKELMSELESLGFPHGTAFDAEWMGPTRTQFTHGANWFLLIDLLYYDGQWQGNIPYQERKAALTTLVTAHRNKMGIMAKNIIVTPYVDKGFVPYYNKQKENPLSEGIVLKSKLGVLNPNGGDNKQWFKIKYR